MTDDLQAGRPKNAVALEDLFGGPALHQGLTDSQNKRRQLIYDSGLNFAHIMLSMSPRCADQLAALRSIREAVWAACAAIEIEVKPEATKPQEETPAIPVNPQ